MIQFFIYKTLVCVSGLSAGYQTGIWTTKENIKNTNLKKREWLILNFPLIWQNKEATFTEVMMTKKEHNAEDSFQQPDSVSTFIFQKLTFNIHKRPLFFFLTLTAHFLARLYFQQRIMKISCPAFDSRLFFFFVSLSNSSKLFTLLGSKFLTYN